MIIILDEFFIRFSDFLINIFIGFIDLIILFLNKFKKFNNLNNFNNNSNNEINFENKEIFNINNFLKNDSIFEELEDRYLNNSSSSISNSPYQSQNIFTSLKNKDDENYGLNGDDGNGNSNFLENITEKIIFRLLNSSYFEINESNLYDKISKIVIMIFSILTITAVLIGYFISLELGLAIFILFLLLAFTIFYFPKIKRQNDYSSFSKELPYALRQMATELKSGKSLFDSIGSIVDSDYGIVSLEFSRLLEEIKYGESTENAFLNLEKRVDSKALSRVIHEILTSLRLGSNLSSSLAIIADDVNFDIRMKLKEYSEKLNAFIMIYTFLAILAPVILLTILLASSVIIGDLVPGDLVLVLYSVFFPMIIVFLGFAIKKLEPKI